MRKHILLWILFAPLSLLSQTSDTLHISCTKSAFREIIAGKNSLPETSTIMFDGLSEENLPWQDLFTTLRKNHHLTSLVFDNNGLSLLPPSIANLTQLKSITILGNEEVDAEEAIEMLSSLKNLEKITWELFSVDDMPYDLDKIPSLKTIEIISTEFADMRIDPLSVPQRKKVEKTEIDRMRDRIDPTKGVIHIVFYEPEPLNIASSNQANSSEQTTDSFNYVRANPVACPEHPFFRKYKSFSPPSESMAPGASYYAVQTDQPSLIDYLPSGTQILIPPRAFVDKNGNEVAGDVIIDYKEFRDPGDFILSGIPMAFPEKDTMKFFRSAGMFEMNASCNGDEVFLKEGTQIKLNFMPTDTSEVYQFFSYNDDSGTWTELGDTQKSTGPRLVPLDRMSAALSSYKQMKIIRDRGMRGDTTLFDERFTNLKYGYITAASKTSFRNKRGVSVRGYNDNLRIRRVRKTKEGEVIFSLEYFPSLHPEINSLRVDFWKLNEDMAAAEFKNTYSKKRSYSDIRLSKNGDDLVMTLKDSKGMYSFHVTSVKRVENDQGRINYVGKPIRFTSYEKTLDQRRKRFNRSVSRNKQHWDRLYDKSDEQIWKNCRSLMSPEELAMTFDEWQEYEKDMAQKEREISASTRNDEYSFTLSLSIAQFGIFNCDQMERLRSPEIIFARYRTIDNKSLRCEKVYVVNTDINAVLIYDYLHALTPSKIALDAEGSFRMAVLDKDGNLRAIKPSSIDLSALQDQASYTFEVEDVKEISVLDFKQSLGLE